jgi:hypothetical protein
MGRILCLREEQRRAQRMLHCTGTARERDSQVDAVMPPRVVDEPGHDD